MSNTRKLVVEILGDAKGMTKATKEAESGLAAFESKVGKLGSALAGVFAGGALLSFGKQAAQAALEDQRAQERLAKTLQNVTQATREQVSAVEAYISKTESQYAVIDDELRPAFETLVRATKDVGQAQQLMQLALDVSAGSGKSLQEVSVALVKAMGGQMRGLKDLGIQVKTTSGDTASFADVQAQLNAMFGGQAAAAADSQTGRMKKMQIEYENVKESIGKALLPMMIQLAGVATTLFGWFNNLSEGTQQFVVNLVAFGAAAFTAVKAFGVMQVALAGLGTTVTASLPELTVLAGVIAGMALVVSKLTGSHEKAAVSAEDQARAIRDLGAGTADTARLMSALHQASVGAAMTGTQFNDVKTVIDHLGLSAGATAQLMKNLMDPNARMTDGMEQFGGQAMAAAENLQVLIDAAVDYPVSVDNMNKSIYDTSAATDKAKGSTEQFNKALFGARQRQQEVEAATKRTTQAILEAADQIRAKFDVKFAADKAALDAANGLKEMNSAVSELSKKLEKNKEHLDRTAEGSKEYKKLVEQQKKLTLEYSVAVEEQADKTLSAAEAVGELAKKQSGLTGAQADAVKNRAMLEYLKDMAFKLDPKNPLQRYLAEWIVQLNGIPSDVNTNIKINWQDNIPVWARDAFKKGWATHYQPVPEPAPDPTLPRAAGGPVSAGRRYLIGERGPELFVPNSSGSIIPNHALGGGGGITVNVNAGMGADPQSIGNAVVSALRSWVRTNGKLAGVAA